LGARFVVTRPPTLRGGHFLYSVPACDLPENLRDDRQPADTRADPIEQALTIPFAHDVERFSSQIATMNKHEPGMVPGCMTRAHPVVLYAVATLYTRELARALRLTLHRMRRRPLWFH